MPLVKTREEVNHERLEMLMRRVHELGDRVDRLTELTERLAATVASTSHRQDRVSAPPRNPLAPWPDCCVCECPFGPDDFATIIIVGSMWMHGRCASRGQP